MLIVERTCPECEFQEVSRVYVDRDKVYIVYPEFRELTCDWKFVLKPFDRLSHKEAKALARELFSAFLVLNNLYLSEQVEKAHQVLHEVRSKESKSWLFQEFTWEAQENTFKAKLHGDIHKDDGKVYTQVVEVVKNGLSQVAYSYHCTCPDHANRGSFRPCKHVLAQVLAFLL